MECIFCRIIKGELSSQIIHEDDDLIAIEDLHPQSPSHILIIPKKHIATINDLQEEDTLLAGRLLLAAKTIAQKEGIADVGYRLTFNCNAGAGQAVYHIHCHLMGGRSMQWPPG